MQSQLKKPLLYTAVVSVILGALLGIIVVLRGQWGWLEIRVILTTLIVAGASLCGLASDLSQTPRGLNLLPKSGLTLTAVGTVLLLIGVWGMIDSEAYWKATSVSCIFAVATVHVALLSIAKLASRFRWVYLIATQVIFGLAILVTAIIVFEISSEALWRFVGAHSIVAAAISLVIPILHRISRSDAKSGEVLTQIELRNEEWIDQRIAELEQQLAQLRKRRADGHREESPMEANWSHVEVRGGE